MNGKNMRNKDVEQYARDLVMRSARKNPVWNVEYIRKGRDTDWNYTDCVMLLALWNLGDTLKDSLFHDYVMDYIDGLVDKDGNIPTYDRKAQKLDDICGGCVLIAPYRKTGNERYRMAASMLRDALASQPRTGDGSYWHKAVYPHQVWLDGIYMALPFLALYERDYGNADYTDITIQIKNVKKNMRDKTSGLYYHGYDESRSAFWADKKTGLSASFWLRSIGWFAMALADLSEILPSGSDRDVITGVFTDLMKSIREYRDPENDMYYQIPDRSDLDGNYTEVSGSSMIAYAMLKGVRLNVLRPEYAEYGRRTFQGIIRDCLTFDRDSGMSSLGGICLSAGLGPESNRRRNGSFSYYISEPVVCDDAKGISPFLMCYTEMIGL